MRSQSAPAEPPQGGGLPALAGSPPAPPAAGASIIAAGAMSELRLEYGCPVALEATATAPPEPVECLRRQLTELGYRTDTARNAAAFAGAVALAPRGERFSLEALGDQLLVDHGLTVGKVRNLLDGGGFRIETLRLELIGDVLDEAKAIVLERSEARPREGRPFDVVTAVLVGPKFAVPVGSRRLWGPPDQEGLRGEDWETLDHDGTVSVLRQLRSDLERLGLLGDAPPLVSFDCAHGQSESLREEIDELGFEAILELGPFFTGFHSEDPGDPQLPRPLLAEAMPFRTGEAPPAPRLLRPGGSQWIVPYRGEDPSYAAACPRIATTPGGLGAYRMRSRAAALGGLAETLVRPEAARRLRLLDFKHSNERGFEVAATILSAHSAVLQGRLTGDAPC